MDGNSSSRIRVAILGGGPGALAAAFELTQTEEQRNRYEVTVYQQGWRLGGKCASGRDGESERILEHGLHMLLGFYDTTFRIMRQCYTECDRAGDKSPARAFRRFDDAVEKQQQITLQEYVGVPPEWKSWNLSVPTLPGSPGLDPGLSLVELTTAFFEWTARKHRQTAIDRIRVGVLRGAARSLEQAENTFASALKNLRPALPIEEAHRKLADHVRKRSQVESGESRRGIASHVESGDPRRGIAEIPRTLLLELLELIDIAKREVEKWSRAAKDEWRRDALLLRLAYAMLTGLVKDVLMHGGDFSRIDHLDYRTWLKQHGARESDTWSAPIKALYDLGFAYVDGVTDEPHAQAAAGVALYVSLRIMFSCHGALLWKMKAGAGDILFAPMYEALKARRVNFKFFHRVEELKLSADKTSIESVRLTVQARTLGDRPYDPLINVPYGQNQGSVPSWPAEPEWEQIQNGEAIQQRLDREKITFESLSCRESTGGLTLERGASDGYDLVVLGISLHGLTHVCKELIAARPAWKRMVEDIRTVQTQSLQLWMGPTTKGLGWPSGPTVSISYVEPLDSWADMSHLLPAERWMDALGGAPGRPSGEILRRDRSVGIVQDEDIAKNEDDGPPHSIQYFCSAMVNTGDDVLDPRTSSRQHEAAKHNAEHFLHSAIAHLWPLAVKPDGALDRSLVRSAYVRANFDPSERYVLSVPGSIAARLLPDCSTFANLYLVGDWVMGEINSGAVEAAMQSAVRAARAIHKVRAAPSLPELRDLVA